MASTLIIGGSGKCARHITRLLVAEGHTVHSLIRNPAQVPEIESLGGKPIVQSIETASVADLTSTIHSTSASTIIWAAGAGGGDPARTRAVDHEGAIKAMDAAAAAGSITRYLVISAIDVRDRAKGPAPEWYDQPSRDRSDRQWSTIGTYMEAKFQADKELVTGNGKRKLEYTIVRPGGLNNEPSKGTVAAGKVPLTATISREDVAKVVIECLKRDETKGLAFDVVGGDTPIAEAVERAARERADTFEGRY